ncbi:MAG: DUF4317 domain-containing protein [Eubacteriales bacterium]|nr:DUF4317 domain-containing protein [Eubacteriales bacterium]
MNKKEVLEIRKLFKPDDCRVNKICACYVDGHKEKILQTKDAFLSLPEEEIFKYTDIFKKTLSGQIGKNLINLEFPLAEEEEGGRQRMLMALRDTRLDDQELIDAFFDSVIRSYLYPDHYLILLIHGTYDVPGRSSSNDEMFDASDYVYNYVMCSICPVTLSKPGLCYNAATNAFIDKVQDWMVQMPEVGFLFPAFTDRNTDIHNLLYYIRNAEQMHPEVTDEILGCTLPLSAGDQKHTFEAIIEETFKDDCSFDTALTVQKNLNALLEGKKEEPEPTPLGKNEIKRFLSDCGAKAKHLEHFEEAYDNDRTTDAQLLASNIATPKKIEVKTDDFKISIDASRQDLLETRIIDGREYLLIPVSDNVTVNGIHIHAAGGPTDDVYEEDEEIF